MDKSLEEKLNSLGMSLGSGNLMSRKKHEYPFSDAFDGKEIVSSIGTTFVINENYPLTYNHGALSLEFKEDLEILNLMNINTRFEKPISLSDFIFIDIETTGLSRGIGTYSFLIGLGTFNQSGFSVTQLLLPGPNDELSLLMNLDQIIQPYKVIVSFNGKAFDIPFLNSRFNLYQLNTNIIDLHNIDLLYLSRKIWRNSLDNRSLNNLESKLLNIRRKEIDIPGWMIPDIYNDYLRTGDSRPLAGVVYHNMVDILSMVVLFNHINDLLLEAINGTYKNSFELISIARLYEEDDRKEYYHTIYEKCINSELPLPYHKQTLLRYAAILKRNNQWQKALHLWKEAAELEDISAHIELAKYYEHKTKDIDAAKFWVDKALSLINDHISGQNPSNYVFKEELIYRLNRLNRKFESNSEKVT